MESNSKVIHELVDFKYGQEINFVSYEERFPLEDSGRTDKDDRFFGRVN
jgi:hypothetical protein